MTTMTNRQRTDILRQMTRCRLFEDRVYYLFLEGRMPGTVHQAQGQEASAVGVCSALEPGDMITSTHRPHEHAVARGIPINSLMAELFAKTTGCCRGKGGSMHLGDVDHGMLPATAIVGGGICIGTSSLAKKALEYTSEGLGFGLPFATDFEHHLQNFLEPEDIELGESFFMGRFSSKGPFMVVAELLI